jgi:hypothetical protein
MLGSGRTPPLDRFGVECAPGVGRAQDGTECRGPPGSINRGGVRRRDPGPGDGTRDGYDHCDGSHDFYDDE